MNLQFEVKKIGELNKKGNYTHTLSLDQVVETPIGKTTIKHNYYIPLKEVTHNVGDIIEMEASQFNEMFNVVELPFLDEEGNLPVDKETGEVIAGKDGKPLLLKWLFLKKAS